jgi:glycosyltransferase involved in cell wall biosynthesis
MVADGIRNLGLAVIGFSPGPGGIGRVMINLLNGIHAAGIPVDLILPQAEHPDLTQLDARIHTLVIDTNHPGHAIDQIRMYSRAYRYRTVLSNKDYSNRLLVGAFRDWPKRPWIVFRIGSHVAEKLKRKNFLLRWKRRRILAHVYRQADALIGNSHGVSAALKDLVGPNGPEIHTIFNPVKLDEIRRRAVESPTHPWFIDRRQPIILTAGRLARIKDHATLLKAFYQVRKEMECRLVILGEGRQRDKLIALAKKLGVEDDCALPGFTQNPFRYLARADLFVLSSQFEGSPNALLEALALKRPVVSTDCPSGPREILANGRYGRLVPTKNPRVMADAILETLRRPPNPAIFEKAVEHFDLNRSVEHYLRVLGITVALTSLPNNDAASLRFKSSK